MNFTGMNYSSTGNILDFDQTGSFVDGSAAFGEIYTVRDGICNESFASTVDRFSVTSDGYPTGSESFTTAADFSEVHEDQFEAEGGEYRERNVIMTDGADRFGVSTTTFDVKEELVWSGNQGGHVTSYLSADLMKYTSFQVHESEEIRDLQTIDSGILALTPTSLNMRTREGIGVFNYRPEEFENLQCVLPLRISRAEDILLIGGHQEFMFEYDLQAQSIIQKHSVGSDGCVIIREHPRFICYGDSTGNIFLIDPRTMKQEHTFKAHSGTLSDFDAQSNYIITCGFSNRLGQMMADQFVMVYDLRMMKMALPLRAMVPPYFLRIMPGLAPCFAAVSPIGQWVVMDASQPETTMVSLNYQLNCMPDSAVTSFDISSSSQALVFGDNHGSLHLFTNKSKPCFNNFSRETVIPQMEQHNHIPITDITTPLSTVPVWFTDEPLLSDWPLEWMKNAYWPTPPIDKEILQAVRMVGSVGYAPNLTNKRRNQMPYDALENIRAAQKSKLVDDAPKKEEGPVIHVPRRYRKIELKYSKMGLDEIDYDSYNRTSFPGLDMSLPNSYCNSMIQVYYYIQPLRAILLSHLCEREFCLACELGFLFRMQDISYGQGVPCQSSNFLRAFRTIPEASAMGLTISDQDLRSRINFASKIQSWNCFVLQQIHTETMEGRQGKGDKLSDNAMHLSDGPSWEAQTIQQPGHEELEKPEFSPISDLFGAKTVSINTCTRCKNVSEKEGMTLTVNLSFHENAIELSKGPVPFSTIVQSSLCLDQVTQAWCESCSKFQPVQQSRRYKTLPTIISMNCGLDSTQDLKYWNSQHEHLLSALHQRLKEESSENRDGDDSREDDKLRNISPLHRKSDPNKMTGSPFRLPGKVRSCRYGGGCVRVGCRFWHPSRDMDAADSDVLSLMEQTMEYSWIPLGLRVGLDQQKGSVTVTNISKEEFPTACDGEDGVIYELIGVISHVSDPKYPDKNNLVACIKVGPTYHLRALVSPVSHWYLFNDISIQPISCEEAVWFPTNWKQPCILYWIMKNVPSHQANLREISPITLEVFEKDRSMARGRKRITFTPLSLDEIPKEGDIIAMDAEFVNLHQEEAEIKIDGTRTTVKPSQKSVARITCIRGQGPLKGTPFIDDYISTQEQVVDYLTQFSGIKPGDLDANYSQKHLTTLKSTYIKLRYLIDRGVKIIGHGLKNDFKVINIVVPPNQLIDTVQMFRLPHNRMVSLKFLAWHFLGVKIQNVTHDSIEDARTALELYEKFHDLSAEMGEYGIGMQHEGGPMMPLLQDLYEAGKRLNWKVSGEDDD